MSCEICDGMKEIRGFGGYLHYTSLRDALAQLVREGVFDEEQLQPYEVAFTCKRCGTVWMLAEPDFPITGFFLRK